MTRHTSRHTSRHVTLLALLVCLCQGQSVRAQEPVPVAPHIDVDELFDAGSKIVASFEGAAAMPGAEESLAWEATKGVSFEAAGRRLFVWAPSGTHTLTLSVVYTIQVFTPSPDAPTDPSKAVLTKLTLPPYNYVATFRVGPETPPIPPPEPDPPKPPTPPVVEGQRLVVILHESEDQTATRARLFTALRTGASAEYLKSKGHTLLILDDDSVDQLQQPLKLVRDLLAITPQLPALYVLDSTTRAVIHSRPLTDAANAEGVLAVVKENGG